MIHEVQFEQQICDFGVFSGPKTTLKLDFTPYTFNSDNHFNLCVNNCKPGFGDVAIYCTRWHKICQPLKIHFDMNKEAAFFAHAVLLSEPDLIPHATMFIVVLLCNDLLQLLSSQLISYLHFLLPIAAVDIMLILRKALYKSSKVIKLSG